MNCRFHLKFLYNQPAGSGIESSESGFSKEETMKILVTGAKGQLGNDVCIEARKRGYNPVGVDVAEMDITNKEQVEEVISRGDYDVVVHCAAWTAVDKAEEPELFETVEAVNALGTKYIADVCRDLDIPLMYFSTD